MTDHIKKHRIGIVDYHLVDQGLSHLEALVFQYVQRFEKNKRPCFASIPHIAAQLRLSERSTKRYIRHLIALGMLYEYTKGRGRYLHTTGAKLASTGAKNVTDWCQIGPNDRCQIGPLPLEELPIKDTSKKIPSYELAMEDSKSLPAKRPKFVNVWDARKNSMVRKRVE